MAGEHSSAVTPALTAGSELFEQNLKSIVEEREQAKVDMLTELRAGVQGALRELCSSLPDEHTNDATFVSHVEQIYGKTREFLDAYTEETQEIIHEHKSRESEAESERAFQIDRGCIGSTIMLGEEEQKRLLVPYASDDALPLRNLLLPKVLIKMPQSDSVDGRDAFQITPVGGMTFPIHMETGTLKTTVHVGALFNPQHAGWWRRLRQAKRLLLAQPPLEPPEFEKTFPQYNFTFELDLEDVGPGDGRLSKIFTKQIARRLRPRWDGSSRRISGTMNVPVTNPRQGPRCPLIGSYAQPAFILRPELFDDEIEHEMQLVGD